MAKHIQTGWYLAYTETERLLRLIHRHWLRRKLSLPFQQLPVHPCSGDKFVNTTEFSFHRAYTVIGVPLDLPGALSWNGNVVILMKFSSLAALKVVNITTSGADSDENPIKMTFSF